MIAVSSGTGEGMVPIDAEAEVAGLENLPDLAAETCRVPAVREDLVRALEEGGERPSALVLAAHGTFDAEERVGAVFLQTPEGKPHSIPAHVLASSLSQSGRLRLAVLNLCSGAVTAAADPHAGLAQDLVARGVPAVAAMRGPISDRAAARFSPELMAKLLENRTVDEAVTAARIAISAVPDHTTVEWSTPVLFLHESHRQGWLFKARRPLKRGETVTVEDPLRGGAQALDEYEREGNVRMDTILTALYHLRDAGDWPRVERIARDHTDSVCRALHAEACRERDWPVVAGVCEALAVSGDADRAEELLGTLSDQWLPELREHLMQEIRAVRLRNATDLAERRCAEGAWASAADAYAEVKALTLTPDQFPEAATAMDYCRARASEEAGDWSEAGRLHAKAGGFADARARAAYSAGRAAAADHKWEAAAEHFTDACALAAGEADPSWTAHASYARGRLATDRDEWAHAAECFERAGELADSPARLLLSRARSAIDVAEWTTALDHLLGLAARGEDAQPWLDEVSTRIREDAEDAAGRCDWATAQGLFGRLTATDPEAARSAAYCAGRLAEQDAQWQQAAGTYETCSGHGDADRRLVYVRARLAEQAGDWSQAADLYAGLPGHLLDTGRRLRYARGRAADAGGDWEGVIHGFGGLPDEAEHGDVGARRRYARARIAEGHGDWSSVLNFLADPADGDRGGAATALREKARGGQAEQRGDWAAALAHYAEAADAYQAPEPAEATRRLYHYARARRHEAAGEWNRAVEAYAQLPGDHRDSADRARYASARDAEQRVRGAASGEAEHWATIADGYAALPPDFEDAGSRARYARALRRGPWPLDGRGVRGRPARRVPRRIRHRRLRPRPRSGARR
ncbi:CHAT domain-containing protein [Streptomyces chiangmaiensis]